MQDIDVQVVLKSRVLGWEIGAAIPALTRTGPKTSASGNTTAPGLPGLPGFIREILQALALHLRALSPPSGSDSFNLR